MGLEKGLIEILWNAEICDVARYPSASGRIITLQTISIPVSMKSIGVQ